jgi:hypothetical protein
MNNIASILIFSDPSLGYDKKDLQFPIDLDKRFPMNGSGLCNQLMRVINTIAYCDPSTNNIYFDLFASDIFSGVMVKLSSVIDIYSMSNRLKDITELNSIENLYMHDDPYVFRLYHSNQSLFEQISKSLIFNNKYESIANSIINQLGLNDKKVNLAHLRIDNDYRIHVTGSENNNFNPEDQHYSNRIKAYDKIVDDYRESILNNCDKNIPLVLLLEDVDHPLVLELKKEYDIFFFTKEMVNDIHKKETGDELVGRELYALIDLLIGKNLNVDNFIGLEQTLQGPDGVQHSSSFSILLKYITNNKKIIMV